MTNKLNTLSERLREPFLLMYEEERKRADALQAERDESNAAIELLHDRIST